MRARPSAASGAGPGWRDPDGSPKSLGNFTGSRQSAGRFNAWATGAQAFEHGAVEDIDRAGDFAQAARTARHIPWFCRSRTASRYRQPAVRPGFSRRPAACARHLLGFGLVVGLEVVADQACLVDVLQRLDAVETGLRIADQESVVHLQFLDGTVELRRPTARGPDLFCPSLPFGSGPGSLPRVF